MLWSFCSGGFKCWGTTDIVYILGLLFLLLPFVLSESARKYAYGLALLGWTIVITAFVFRFTTVMTGNEGNQQHYTIALFRSVLHTLVFPWGISVLGAGWALMRVRKCLKWYVHLSVAVILILFAVLCSSRLAATRERGYWHYPAESKFP